MYPLIDLHCDTIYALEAGESHGSLIENDGHTDVRWMEMAGSITTTLALYVPLEHGISPWQTVVRMHDRFLEEISIADNRVVQVRTAEEIRSNPVQGALLSCEEFQILEGELNRISTLASWGVRIATLIWNNENDLGYPNGKTGGLKPFGYEAVAEMERNGILVDVSHLNDDGFYDIAKVAGRPFIASHSNCRAITNHSRNLSDAMIRKIADAGGVVGLNFCPSFLSEDWGHSSLEAMVRHACHLKQVGGSQVIAVGTDFDGIYGTLEIDHYSKMNRLWDALAKRGFSSTDLEGMWSGNALRVLA
ncbi:membrane dipeptidase [uncultured Sphaerochaeta sp.]|uniref:dipeptidase n=1 Tax=uncultured Sphaerochaeta sp. TaxID=886478 RepID=UPI0029CA1347|nr:membrane dipeptidase [uncultured Sphaerochaeta sp.]